nr:hypothetical protein [Tanacetum cinerariifolium]
MNPQRHVAGESCGLGEIDVWCLLDNFASTVKTGLDVMVKYIDGKLCWNDSKLMMAYRSGVADMVQAPSVADVARITPYVDTGMCLFMDMTNFVVIILVDKSFGLMHEDFCYIKSLDNATSLLLCKRCLCVAGLVVKSLGLINVDVSCEGYLEDAA